LTLACVANAQMILQSMSRKISQKSQTISQLKRVTITEDDLADSLKSDIKVHNVAKGVRAVQLMPEAGDCSLHWDLCPNMCNLNDTLHNYFMDIVGTKMQKYQDWKEDTAEKKRRIIKDLEGKLDQVDGLEDQLRKNGLDLERREELFIATLDDHIAQSMALKERLQTIKEDFQEMEIQFGKLGQRVDNAHSACYDMAPCMAVPTCKLGVASGASCQKIAENAMDVDDEGEATLNKENGVYIIQPQGLEAKAAICEFDYTGTGYTVVQNRHNRTNDFNGDYENGFGTTVGYDDAACAEANYFLGNKYIRALANGASHVKVKQTSGNDVSVDQWDGVSVRGNKMTLGRGEHLCGSTTTDKADVRLGPGGLNGRWTGQTQIMIGKDTSPAQDNDCVGGDYGNYGGGDADYGSYGGKGGDYY
jgi:hypothetical protein